MGSTRVREQHPRQGLEAEAGQAPSSARTTPSGPRGAAWAAAPAAGPQAALGMVRGARCGAVGGCARAWPGSEGSSPSPLHPCPSPVAVLAPSSTSRVPAAAAQRGAVSQGTCWYFPSQSKRRLAQPTHTPPRPPAPGQAPPGRISRSLKQSPWDLLLAASVLPSSAGPHQCPRPGDVAPSLLSPRSLWCPPPTASCPATLLRLNILLLLLLHPRPDLVTHEPRPQRDTCTEKRRHESSCWGSAPPTPSLLWAQALLGGVFLEDDSFPPGTGGEALLGSLGMGQTTLGVPRPVPKAAQLPPAQLGAAQHLLELVLVKNPGPPQSPSPARPGVLGKGALSYHPGGDVANRPGKCMTMGFSGHSWHPGIAPASLGSPRPRVGRAGRNTWLRHLRASGEGHKRSEPLPPSQQLV